MTDSSTARAGPPYREIVAQGLWHNNAGLVQLLGLCPLLAVSNSVVNALGLGLATLVTLAACNAIVSLSRPLLRPEIRIPAFVLVIASVVTAIELVMQAWFHDLFLVLGIFIPLIVTKCDIIGRAEAFASRQPLVPALVDGIATGAGFLGVLVLLGAMRELLGRGTLLGQADLLFGAFGQRLELVLLPGFDGFLLALLPPGAFIGLGLLVALKNYLGLRRQRPRPGPVEAPASAGTGGV